MGFMDKKKIMNMGLGIFDWYREEYVDGTLVVWCMIYIYGVGVGYQPQMMENDLYISLIPSYNIGRGGGH